MNAAVTAFGLLVAATLVHFEVLSLLTRWLARVRWSGRLRVLVAVAGCLVGHAIEIALYALAYGWLVHAGHGTLGGATPSLADAAYFSAETYTSLGFGDVVPKGSVRLLAGVEALNGLLLIGWSASFLFIEMQRHWRPHAR